MEQPSTVFEFGPFVLEVTKRRLLRGSEPVKLYPKEFDVLLVLVERRGAIVDKEELLTRVWPDATVEEGNLTTHVSNLRKTLGGAESHRDYIVTIPGRGYQFVAEVREKQSSTVGAPAMSSSRHSKVVVGWAIAAIFLAAAAAAAIWATRAGRETQTTFAPVTFRKGTILSARFAPDGQTIVYSAALDGRPLELFSTRPGTPESRPLGHAADVLSISAAGEMAVLLNRQYSGKRWEPRGILARVSLAGGAPRELERPIKDADWAPDGVRLAVVRRVASTDRLEFPSGTVLCEVYGFIIRPRVAPDGKTVAFLQRQSSAESVELVSISGERKTLATVRGDLTGLAWSAGGDELFFTVVKSGSTDVHAVTINGRQRRIAQNAGEWSVNDVSRSGRVLMIEDHKQAHTRGVAPGSGTERDLSWLDRSAAVALSSDGGKVLLSEIGAGGGQTRATYIRGTDGSPAVRLGDGEAAALSPDGRWAIVKQGSAPERLVVMPTGAGTARMLANGPLTDYWDVNWLPDGKKIVFGALSPGRARRPYVQDVAGGEPRPLDWKGVVASAVFLGDGTYVALGPRGRYYVFGTDTREPRLIAEVAPREQVVQATSDGETLFVNRQEGTTFHIDRLHLSSGHREPWKQVTIADPVGVMHIGPEYPRVLVTPDASAYVYNYLRVLSTLYIVDGLK